MVKILKILLMPLIWIKNLKGNVIKLGTGYLAKKTGADKSNKFKEWKFKQPIWKQFLIEAILLIIVIYIIYLITNIVIIIIYFIMV